jgi:hypothetical protein
MVAQREEAKLKTMCIWSLYRNNRPLIATNIPDVEAHHSIFIIQVSEALAKDIIVTSSKSSTRLVNERLAAKESNKQHH